MGFDFSLVFNAIFPTFFIIALGVLAHKSGEVPESFVNEANRLIFQWLLPLYMFLSIYRADDLSGVPIHAIFYLFVFLTVTFVVVYVVLRKTNFTRPVKAVVLQSTVRTNIIIFGLSIAERLYSGEDLKLIAVSLGLLAPFANMLAVLSFELFSKDRLSVRKLIYNIFHNRIIQFALVGLLFQALSIRLPAIVLVPLNQIGGLATPIGLFALGAKLSFRIEPRSIPPVRLSLFLRNFLLPLLGIGLAMAWGFRGKELFLIMICVSSPCAISSYVMTVNYTDEGNLCSMIILLSTILSAFLIFLELLILKGFQWI